MQSKDVQASHQIIHFLETAKLKGDQVLDSVPGVFAVLALDGTILRANKGLATLLMTGHEALLGRNLSELFTKHDWEIFTEQMNSCLEAPNSTKEFEMPVSLPRSDVGSYWWQIMSLVEDASEPLVTVMGKDISELNRVTQERVRMQLELDAARVIQDTLFLPNAAKLGPVEIAGHYEPATECGGDWWYYFQKDDRVFLFIGDVTGHGVPAALVTSAVRSAVSLMETLPDWDLCLTMERLNRVVFDGAKGERWMTFCLASIETRTGELRYVRAGHDPAFLFTTSPGKPEPELTVLMGESNPLLGFSRDSKFVETSLQLHPGDRLIFYTDGVTDIVSPDGRTWNQRGFRGALTRALTQKRKSSADVVLWILDEMRAFRKGTGLLDDVTFFTAAIRTE